MIPTMVLQKSAPSSNRLDRIGFSGLLLLVVAAVFGTSEVVAAIGTWGLGVFWVTQRLYLSEGGDLRWVASSVNPMILAFIGICALQLVPLPANLLAKLSPQTFADKSAAFAVLSGGAKLASAAIAYVPEKAAVKLSAIAAVAGGFFLALNALTNGTRITAAASVMAGLGAAQVLVVSWRIFSDANNSVADFAATGVLICALPSAIGLYLPTAKRLQRLARFPGWPAASASLAIAAVLLICAPPTARLAEGLALLAAAALFFAAKRDKKRGVAFLVFGLFFMATLWTGPADAPGASMLARTVPAVTRDYPLLGVGLGSYSELYPRYAAQSLPTQTAERIQGPEPRQKVQDENGKTSNPMRPVHVRFGAELAAETGVPAFAVLLFGAGYLLFRIAKIQHRRPNRYAGIGVGAGAGVFALLLFGLTGPHVLSFAHLLCGAVLAAVAKAAVSSRSGETQPDFSFSIYTRRISVPRAIRPLILLAVIAAVGSAAVMVVRSQKMIESRGPALSPTLHLKRPVEKPSHAASGILLRRSVSLWSGVPPDRGLSRRRYPDIVCVRQLGLVTGRDQEHRLKRGAGPPECAVGDSELADDMAVSGQNEHTAPAQVPGDRFGHGVFPDALGLVEKVEAGGSGHVMKGKDLLHIGPVPGVGQVHLVGDELPVRPKETVDSSGGDLRRDVKGDVEPVKGDAAPADGLQDFPVKVEIVAPVGIPVGPLDKRLFGQFAFAPPGQHRRIGRVEHFHSNGQGPVREVERLENPKLDPVVLGVGVLFAHVNDPNPGQVFDEGLKGDCRLFIRIEDGA